MSKMQDTNFDWHAEVGNREMRGTAVNAIERDSRKVGAVDLMAVFLGLELMSIPLYVMAGFDRRNLRGRHASTAALAQLTVAAPGCWAAACCAARACRASNVTSGSRNGGKPPFVTSSETVERAYDSR